jgi:hypothetical protein
VSYTNDPQFARVRTSFTTDDYARALFYGWRDVFGEFPTKAQCAVLFAQWALETGKGHFCWNNNLGNVKEIPNDGLPYFALPGTWEIEAGKRVVLDVKDPGSWFTAFPTLADGMAHHLRFLSTKRYAPAWPAVLEGDPYMFAANLKARGYYTAPLADYAAGMKRLFAEFMRDDAYELARASSLVGHGPEKEAANVPPPVDFEPRRYDDGPGA